MLLVQVAVAQDEDPPADDPEAPEDPDAADAEGEEADAEAEEEEPGLTFIADNEDTKTLADGSNFTPNVMVHNDARDVLRKLVKEKETAFIIQFYKGAPDRDLRDDIFSYALMPKAAAGYSFGAEYEYAEIDVEDSMYKDLIDNLSFKKKFEGGDYPYVLYTFGGKGYMIHGPGAAREVFDLRTEVEASAKKEEEPEEEEAPADDAAADDAAADDAAAADTAEPELSLIHI